MKVTGKKGLELYYEINGYQNVIEPLLIQSLSIKTRYRLNKLNKKLKEELEEIEKIKSQLDIESPDYVKSVEELYSQEIELPDYNFTLDDFDFNTDQNYQAIFEILINE